MNKFISFILDEKKVRNYFGTYFKVFFILITNFTFLFLSIFVLTNTNDFINFKEEEIIISILITLNFFYIIYFNFKNNVKLKKSLVHKSTRISIYIFLIILYFKSIYLVKFSFLYFFVSFLYIIFLNILLKNKNIKYYLLNIIVFFITFFLLISIFGRMTKTNF